MLPLGISVSRFQFMIIFNSILRATNLSVVFFTYTVKCYPREIKSILYYTARLEITFATFPIMVIGNQDFLPIK